MAAMARTGTKRKAAQAESDSVPRCCFKVRPFRFDYKGEFVRLGESCQFANEFANGEQHVDIAGHWFCPYHLPFNESDFAAVTQAAVALSGADKARLKSAWSEDRQEAFNHAILSDKVAPALRNQVLCDLTGVVFPGQFNADRLSFPAVSFAHARFSGGHAWFGRAQFSGGVASFEGAQFSGGAAWFRGAQFSGGSAWFEGAQFSVGAAEFEGAQFSGGAASFRNAQFSGGDASFAGAQFSGGRAWFDGARFSGGWAEFADARFAGFASFTAPRHDARAKQGQDPGDFDFSHVNFRSAQFEGRVTFENRRFSGRSSFTDARFAEAPKFHGCTLHQDTTFPAMENFGGREGEEAAPAYRTLKLAMGQHRATDEEAMFWALEQIATRSTLKPSWRHPGDFLPWLFSWLYEEASFYGLSVTRPLVLFLTSTFIAFPIYIYMLMHAIDASVGPYDEISFQQFANTFSFSMRQVTRPFDIWGSNDIDALKLLYPSPKEPSTYFGTKLIATAQSILSLTLVTLFLLALRRRFRMV
jgi:uncharacterized protein YjbI with pentapeptide repeats